MLDHVFTDAIGALRDALESALLERVPGDEHFQLDVLTGDTSWETSYGLPGEDVPARVRADITLDWPTYSQSAFRTWLNGDEPDDAPRIDIGIVLRVQALDALPDPASLLSAVPRHSAPVGPDNVLERTTPTIETSYDTDLAPVDHAIEFSFEGSYELDDDALGDGSTLDAHFANMGGWIASVLVLLGDIAVD